MGARRMTLSDFYAANGFGQGSTRGAVAYPEFPTHNAKLQELYRHVDPEGAVVAPILGQLDLARAYGEQSLHLQVAQALAAADVLLDAALRAHGPGGSRWVAILLAVLAALALVWWLTQRRRRLPGRARTRKNLPPPPPPPTRRRRRRSRAKAKKNADDEPDEDEPDEEPEPEPDDDEDEEPEDDDAEDADA